MPSDDDTHLTGDASTVRARLESLGARTVRVQVRPADAPAAAPSAGDRLGDYPITGTLGQGGMGEILQIRDEDIGREMAAKVIRGQADRLTLGKFVQEARVTGQLEHPNIVPVHALGLTADGRAYFTMRRVAGQDLRQLLDARRRQGATGADRQGLLELLRVFDKVCDAMRFAHSRGVIHRDLKPANIMVGAFGEVQVMDWGLARLVGQDDATPATSSGRVAATLGEAARPLATRDGAVMGTPAYMPPEQARGEVSRLDARADVYALGAILYALLTLEPPFEGASLSQVLEQVREGRLVPPRQRAPRRDVPWELEAVVLRAMQTDPGRRYPSVAELQGDVQAYLAGRLLEAADYSRAQALAKWIRRNRAVTAVLTTLAVAVLIVGWQLRRTTVARRGERRALDDRTRALGERTQALTERTTALDQRTRALEVASRRLEQFNQLADLHVARTLTAQVDTLWPLVPELIPRAERWLREVASLRERLAGHVSAVARLSRRREDLSDVENVLLSALTEVIRLTRGLLAQSDVQHPYRPTVDGVTRRIRMIRQLAEWDRAQALPWTAARRRGLPLAPISGLRPIGRDPASGLWELAHGPSGADLPSRDPRTRRLRPTARTGLVFVLVPAGRVRMGASAERDGAMARAVEQPVVERQLSAFLISKYEVTQVQWYRLTGETPSLYPAGTKTARGAVTPQHPVERVSWLDCDRACRRWGFALPTEAQWEYAARAGTLTSWWTGRAPETLRGAANLADAAYRQGGGTGEVVGWNDGHPVHMPVGRLRPNAFGLHDVAGNVWEWTQDRYGRYGGPPSRNTQRIQRGGSWKDLPHNARSACRLWSSPEYADGTTGLRPVILLDE